MKKSTFIIIKRKAISDIEKVKNSKISRISSSDKKSLAAAQEIIEKLEWKDFQKLNSIERSSLAIEVLHLIGIAYELYHRSG